MALIIDLDRLRQEQPPEEKPEAISAFAAEKQDLETAQQREVLAGLVQDRQQRKKYSQNLFVLICVWIYLIITIVFMHGCRLMPFSLTEAELVTLIGSTTINVLGLFVIVARYLFPNK